MSENKLHTAVMQAVDLLNGILPKIHSHEQLRRAHDTLRQALVDYADEALEMTTDRPAGHNMVAMLYASGADNYYIERIVSDHDPREIEVIARYIDGETPVEQLAAARVKLENYEKTLARIAEGEKSPMLLARAVLSGAKWDVR
ncbi:hypothetical protein [Stenotrophomonas phage BUCTxx99]|nr:hypothetical protein [Stenotrophomonas phage BUCTxx99]